MKKIIFIAVFAALLALFLYIIRDRFGNSYYAVYFTSGDLYFGKLNYFPRPALTDVHFLERGGAADQSSLKVAKFSQAFWGPEDKIYLNDQNILWKAKLKKDSPILQSIK